MKTRLKKAVAFGFCAWLAIVAVIPVLGSYFVFQRTHKFVAPFTGPYGAFAWHEYWTELVPICFAIIMAFTVTGYGVSQIWNRRS